MTPDKITRIKANNIILRSKINVALIWLRELEAEGQNDPALFRAINELQDAIRSTEDENHGEAQ